MEAIHEVITMIIIIQRKEDRKYEKLNDYGEHNKYLDQSARRKE